MSTSQGDGSFGTVRAVTSLQLPQPMYNLTVDHDHTFFVGAGQWLVHNDCPEGPINPNDLHHIFENPSHEHNLQDLVGEFGSQEEAYRAIQDAVQARGFTGLIYREVVRVGSQILVVTGKVVNGIVRISTAWRQ